MKKFFEEFKEFINQGNVMEMCIRDSLSLHAEEQHEVVAQTLGDLDLRVGLDSLGGCLLYTSRCV